MSRSTKKPIYKDGYGTKGKAQSKRRASRAIRASTEVPSGGAYKKIYCSWNICDYTFHAPKDPKARRK